MCRRYSIERPLDPSLSRIIQKAQGSSPCAQGSYRKPSLKDQMVTQLGRPFITSGEIAPGFMVPVLASAKEGSHCAIFPMVWGWNAKGGMEEKGTKKVLIVNARVEDTVYPFFSESLERRRCIIPASCYYDWKIYRSQAGETKTGRKFLIQPKGATVTWLTGLYRIEDGFPYFAILTKPNPDRLMMNEVHERIPVMLPYSCVNEWLNPRTSAEQVQELLKKSLNEMIYEPMEEWTPSSPIF